MSFARYGDPSVTLTELAVAFDVGRWYNTGHLVCEICSSDFVTSLDKLQLNDGMDVPSCTYFLKLHSLQ